MNVLVQLVFRGEDLLALFAGILESLRKVNVLKVVQGVAFSVESLLAEAALETLLLADHQVLFQRFPPCNRFKSICIGILAHVSAASFSVLKLFESLIVFHVPLKAKETQVFKFRNNRMKLYFCVVETVAGRKR